MLTVGKITAVGGRVIGDLGGRLGAAYGRSCAGRVGKCAVFGKMWDLVKIGGMQRPGGERWSLLKDYNDHTTKEYAQILTSASHILGHSLSLNPYLLLFDPCRTLDAPSV